MTEIFPEDDGYGNFTPNYAAARLHLAAAREAVGQNREALRAEQVARRDALLGHVAEVQAEIARIDEELNASFESVAIR